MKTFIFILLFSLQSYSLVTEWDSNLPDESDFMVHKDMRQRVDFWKKVYAEYSENQGVFHNVNNPEKVYGEIDFGFIKNNKNLTAYQKKHRIQKFIDSERQKIAKKNKIKNLKVIRLQTGLKERMQKALFLSGRYLPMMEKIFTDHDLPIELTRLVFVESSFNITAQSKVGASGLWQIMPFVARPEGYIKKYYDKRNHPYYATLLAASILKQNYRGLKKWPLAVSAYNHGLYGVKRMVKLNNSRHLPDLIESDEVTRNWGFASKNFYACFLAVLEVEKEAKSLFGKSLIRAVPMKMNHVVTKKLLPKKQALKYFGGSYSKFKKYNPHLNYALINKKNRIPAGVPLVLPRKVIDSYTRVVATTDL